MTNRRLLATSMLTLSAVVAAGLVFAATRAVPVTPLTPRLLISTTSCDLGRTTARSEQQVTFPLKNTGSRRLVLNEIDVACGCGNPVVRTLVIPPADEDTVTVTLDTRFASGPIEKTVYFRTNDPLMPEVTLSVKACVNADTSTH